MAFSWKKTMKVQLMKLKARRHNYLKNGENQRAKDVEHRIERLEREIKDGT